MIDPEDLDKYSVLYKDFLHPNPNIYSEAVFLLRKEFRAEFMENLLANLKVEDLVIRRKSILALGEYGEEILSLIVPLYFKSSNNNLVKVSCLKTILKVTVKFNLNELNQDVMSVLDLAIKDSSPEIILSAISLLRQLGKNGRDFLIKTCRDKDLLRAKASITALLEIKDQTIEDFFDELLNDKSIDPMIKEDILRDRMT